MVSQSSFLLLLLLCATTLHRGACITNWQIRCNENDRSALLIFRRGVVNHSNKLPSWSTQEDCCEWKGVHCDNTTGRVTRLDLNQHYLQGQINLSLFQIQFLSYLDLSLNGFTTLIAPSHTLATFSNLHFLDLINNIDLSFNVLQGPIPKSLLSLRNLKSLRLHYNELNGSIPEWLGLHEQLHLSNANLGPKFPEWIYTQQSLVYLEVPNSRISSINGDMFWRFVANITQVNLSKNTISADLTNITLNSEIIFMDHNNFTGWLPNISANVILLDLSHNSLFGPISPLSCNKLDRENSLDYLDISSNVLTGGVPDCWEYWKSLTYLFMDSNRLTGVVPPSMASLIHLTILDFSNNSLSGSFSLDLSNITNLEFINIKQNNFSGTVPTKMPLSMEVMLLGSNQFEGNIPPQLCNLSSLIQLELSHNKLSGPIPPCISDLPRMGEAKRTNHYPFAFNLYNKGQELDYRDYGLLRTLDLSSNNLSGEIPAQVFSLVQLQSLNLSRNHFTGKISREIGRMKNLESLDLSNNKLYGEIPVSISSISFLGFLNLSYNNFTGQIPLGTQLQSFNASIFAGNPGLCGAPLPIKCTEESGNADVSKQHGGNNDEPFETESLYLGMGVGFAVGFWGLCGSLFLNKAWRHVYIRFLNHVVDQLYVFVVVMFNSFSGTRA
ncbi:Leucine-rich repeat receptor-like protein kinase PXC2, partial [Mucuna pruriens]